jgi:ATP-dependent Clp protease protease subunit
MNDKNENRTIVISSTINSDTAKTVIEKIVEYNTDDRSREKKEVGFKPSPISLIINTGGGYVTDGFAIISAILTSKTPVYTICFGRAMSMGFAIFAAGHKRIAHSLSLFMYHEIGSTLWGKLQDIKDDAKFLELQMKMYDQFILERTKITREKLDEVKEKRIDWYLTADDAVKCGLADELL